MTISEKYAAAALFLSLGVGLLHIPVVQATEDLAKAKSALPTISKSPFEPSRNPALIAKLRSFSELQQRVVNGDKAALAEQVTVARAIATDIAHESNSAWQSSSGLHSLIKYVLSGGDPTVLGRLITSTALPETERSLARGVLAYARGDRSGAAAQLDLVKQNLLGPSLGGHVALVKAVISSHSSTARALDLCQEAALLSPGTHIEEAAIRLSISLAIESGDIVTVERAHRQHLLRFPRSLYASDIDARVARVLVVGSDVSNRLAKKMEGIADLIPPQRRRAFFAQLAEAALRAGELKTAISTARLALLPPRSAPASDTESTATLLAIEGAALVLAADRKEGVRRLDEANAAGPGAEAAGLIAAARNLVTMIERSTRHARDSTMILADNVGGEEKVLAIQPAIPKTEHAATAKLHYQEVLSKGKSALATADQLLEQAVK